MLEKPPAPVQVRWRRLVIRAVADKAGRRSITISYLHPSSSLHQRPKASVTSDAALITTCPCFDCLRVALSHSAPPLPHQLLNLECPADFSRFSTIPASVPLQPRWSSKFTHACFARAGAQRGCDEAYAAELSGTALFTYRSELGGGGGDASRLCLTRAEAREMPDKSC